MFNKPTIVIAVVVALLVGMLLIVNCHRRMGHCFFHASSERRAEFIVKKISKELDLNDQQQTRLEQIKDEIITKKDEFKGVREDLFNAILTQIKSEKVDQDVLNQLFESKETQMKEMRGFMLTKLAEFHQMLEPEQKLRLAEKMEKFHNKYHN